MAVALSRKTTWRSPVLTTAVVRHGELAASAGRKLDIAVHVGLEREAGIGEFDADLEGARRGIDLREDVADLARSTRGRGCRGG